MASKLRIGIARGGRRRRPFARLLADTGGTTFAIVGASLIPMAAMVGSGIDLSRAYMAQSRLQTACDAAALAGRRAMSGDSLSTAAADEARRFFNFNFEQGRYRTAAFIPSITRPSAGTVRVQASTQMQTSIMHMFGFQTLPISTTCEATQNFVNTDIVLVLDVTGSMEDDLNGTSKIVSMRDAVMALYDELTPVQTQLQAAGMRLRYSIVPYSSTVNVGRLLQPGHLVNSWAYQSRMPIHFTADPTRTERNKTVSECTSYARAKNPGDDVYPATQTFASPQYPNNTRSDCYVTKVYFNTDEIGQWSGSYLHVSMAQDVSRYKRGDEVDLPTREPGTSTKSGRWAGCIEERQTDPSISASSGYNIPADAYDLDIDLVPTNDETRWKPAWPDVTYSRGNSERDATLSRSESDPRRASFACPAQARRLAAITRADMKTYVDGLVPTGGTYHDVGMIWGARMISSAGVFADSPDTFNGMPTSRHVIFMTDGELKPENFIYSLYGQERYDQRITGRFDAAEQYARHEQRFRMMCNATKGKRVSLWVIAFGVDSTSALNDCASNSAQVSTIANRDALIAKFKEIGKNVGALRLHQ